MTKSLNRQYTVARIAAIGTTLAIAFAAVSITRYAYSLGAQSGSSRETKALQITREALRKQTASRDSLLTAQAQKYRQDSAKWSLYVKQIRAADHDSLQSALQHFSQRHALEVSKRFTDSPLRDPYPGDLPNTHDSACLVSISCDQAAAILAGDSLRNMRGDSLSNATQLAAAACSTVVLTERVRADSLAALPNHLSWKNAALSGAVGAGIMATFVAILSITQ